jgi:broad specificity phosphatase PhoE
MAQNMGNAALRMGSLAFAVSAALVALPQVTLGGDAVLTGPHLLQALRQGGLVVYLRHGATHAGETDFWQQGGDWDRKTLEDCTRQRNLSPAGREQAQRMGQAIARLKLNWATVLASPYCRTRQTAQLAFGKGDTAWDLFYHLAAGSKRREDGDAVLAAVRRMLGAAPAPGTNTVLVSHGGNLSAVAGIYLAEGECAVFRPGPAGAFQLVGRIGPEDWAALDSASPRKADALRDALQRRWVFRHVDRAYAFQGPASQGHGRRPDRP